jgi:hypothetical protein
MEVDSEHVDRCHGCDSRAHAWVWFWGAGVIRGRITHIGAYCPKHDEIVRHASERPDFYRVIGYEEALALNTVEIVSEG